MVRIRPAKERDLTGVVFLPWSSSAVESFFDKEGKLCARFDGQVRDYFAGWQSSDPSEPACDHDTFDDGLHTAILELRWHGNVPTDGDWDVISGGFSVGAWGRVQARGSYYGDFVARAQVVLDATSAHCSAQWSSSLAKAAVTRAEALARDFTGWTEIPDLHLSGCKAGDPIDVRIRLVGDSNRGRIEVDAFGFSTLNNDELNRIFGVRRGSGSTAAAASPR
jgi:hypothetical protein